MHGCQGLAVVGVVVGGGGDLVHLVEGALSLLTHILGGGGGGGGGEGRGREGRGGRGRGGGRGGREGGQIRQGTTTDSYYRVPMQHVLLSTTTQKIRNCYTLQTCTII